MLAIYGVFQILKSIFGERVALYVDGKLSFIQPSSSRLDGNQKNQKKMFLILNLTAKILVRIRKINKCLSNQVLLKKQNEKKSINISDRRYMKVKDKTWSLA